MSGFAPITRPDFQDGAFIDGKPVATINDLMALRREWNEVLPQKVMELALNSGAQPILQPSSDVTQFGQVPKRISYLQKRIYASVKAMMPESGNGLDLFSVGALGDLTFFSSAQDAKTSILAMGVNGPEPTRWRDTGTNKGGEHRWVFTVTGNRYLTVQLGKRFYTDPSTMNAAKRELWYMGMTGTADLTTPDEVFAVKSSEINAKTGWKGTSLLQAEIDAWIIPVDVWVLAAR